MQTSMIMTVLQARCLFMIVCDKSQYFRHRAGSYLYTCIPIPRVESVRMKSTTNVFAGPSDRIISVSSETCPEVQPNGWTSPTGLTWHGGQTPTKDP